MNTSQQSFIPAPYSEWSCRTLSNILLNFNWIDAKNNELLSQYYCPPIQQAQPAYVGSPMLVASGDHPVTCNCPHCHQPIVTRVKKNNGLMVWLAAGGLCIVGCICGCCLIPFCINDLKVWKIKN
jgi:hypothetical protein